MGVSVKPVRSCRAWLTYMGLSEVKWAVRCTSALLVYSPKLLYMLKASPLHENNTMDHTSLLNALTTALESAPQTEDVDPIFMLLQAASAPSRADQRLVRLLEQLRQTPELEEFHDGMQVVGHTAHAVSYPSLARWLLVRAGQVGAEQTMENLLRFLAASELRFRRILALGGITLDSSCTLGRNITLLPWAEIIESLGGHSARTLSLWPAVSLDRPTAALVRETALPRLIVPQTKAQQGANYLTPVDDTDLQDALLCIGLVGPVAPYEIFTWFEPPEWAPILEVSPSATLHEGLTLRRSLWPSAGAVQARELYERFSQLSPHHKDLMRLRMRRLNSAMRRQNQVDAAIDLGITLESLFLNDVEEELSFRLKLRAARFLSQDYEDRVRVFHLVNDLYIVRSAAVHSGRLPTKKKFQKHLHATYGAQPIAKLLEEGFSLAAQAITSFLQTGERQPKDWTKITLA
jgi:hypothetical protein